MTAPIEIPLRSRRNLANLGAATAFVGIAGVGLLAAESTGTHSVAGRVFGICFALVLLLFAVILAVATVTEARPHALVVDAEGLRWRAARGGWHVRWSELATVAVHVGQPVGDRGWRQRIRVHLVLTTDDPGFRGRHPEFDGLRGRYSDSGPNRVGIPFADRPDLVAPVDAALRSCAGDAYRGVVDDGRLLLPGYRPQPDDDRPTW